MHISVVVAVSENQVIGKDNQLLWRLPNDMKFFKNTTWAMPVIMGRKTFVSLGKPLPGRTNIIITRNESFSAEGAVLVNSLEAALEAAAATAAKEAYVIGGGEIYKQVLPLASTVYLTRVHTAIEGDTFFPALDEAVWYLYAALDFKADARHAFDYSFQIWKRKDSPQMKTSFSQP